MGKTQNSHRCVLFKTFFLFQDLPSIIIQGRFGSGRHSIGKELAQKLRCTLVLPENLAEEDSTGDGDRARDLVTQVRENCSDLVLTGSNR